MRRTTKKIPTWVREVKFDSKGLVPAVIQDFKTHEVLMVAFMNKQALRRTVTTKQAHFYSRSRKKLWLKGESSGHIQQVRSISFDCDGDTLLVKVKQAGGACHTGYKSCFYRKLNTQQGRWKKVGKPVFNPKKVYGK